MNLDRLAASELRKKAADSSAVAATSEARLTYFGPCYQSFF